MLSVLIVHPERDRREDLGGRLREAGYAVAQVATPAELGTHTQVDAWIPHAALSVQARREVLGRIGRAREVVDTGEDGPILHALAVLATETRPLVQLSVGALDLRGQRVLRDGAPVALTGRESALLAWLISRPGQVVSRGELLEKVWGYRPDMVTRTVDVTVARLREKIERNTGNPEHLLTVRGEGYRLVVPETEPALQHPGLLGREADLQRLRRATGPGRLVNVWGPGGVGKTTLVQAIAAECGAMWVGLVGVPEGLMVALARALELPNLKSVTPESLCLALGHRGVKTLVLDNVEHLQEEARVLVDALLACAPEICVVVTSRVRLDAQVEVLVKLAPLRDQASRTLLLTRAQLRHPGWGEQDPAVDGILALLDGLPLALELAASRAAVMDPAQLLRRLREDSALLEDGASRLDGTVAWAWELLAPQAQRVLTALCLFPGGAALEALEALFPGLSVAKTLDELLSANLVRRVGRRFLPYVGVAERAQQASDAALREAHAQYFGAWARAQDCAAWGPDGWDALTRMREERENLLICLQAPTVAGDAAVALLHEWETRDAPRHELLRVEAALESDLAPIQRARVLRVVIWARLQFGRLSQAEALQAPLRALIPALPDEEAAWAYYVLGDVGRFTRPDRGKGDLERVLELAPMRPQALRASLYLMDSAGADGLADAAAVHLARAEALCEHLDSQTLRATTLCAHASLLLRLQRWERALAACRQGLAERERLPLALVGAYLAMSGVAHRGAGRQQEALEAFDRCLAMYRHWGAVRLEGVGLENRARCLLALGRLDEALDAALQAIRLASRSGGARLEVMARSVVVRVWLSKGALGEAEQELRAAEALATDKGMGFAESGLVALRDQVQEAKSEEGPPR